MLGSVDQDLEAKLRLTLVGVDHREVVVEVTIDTGFTGGLSLPEKIVHELGWQFNIANPTLLGDGSERMLKYYRGIVIWHDAPRLVDVLEGGSRMLVGTALIRGSDLFIRMKPGGEVRIIEIA